MVIEVQPTVVCIKWGTAFGSEEVNILFRASRAYGPERLRFICLTDNPRGLEPAIEHRTIPDIRLTDAERRHPGVWPKLSLFSPELADLGRVLFVDLDMMIVGDLAPFFAPSSTAVFQNMGPSWRPNPKDERKEPGTCIFSYDPGAEKQVLDSFLADKAGIIATWRNEQDFVSSHVNRLEFWPDGLVLSFKRHLCHRNGLGLFLDPLDPPSEASVIAFHGTPRPDATVTQRVWGAFPHLHFGKVPWIVAYRKRFGNR